MTYSKMLSILAGFALLQGIWGCGKAELERVQPDSQVPLKDSSTEQGQVPVSTRISPMAQKKNDGVKVEKKNEQLSASKTADQFLNTNFERGTYLRKKNQENKEDRRAGWIKRYGLARLDKAATIKRYAPITIMPVQLEAHCSTAWDKGMLHVRVAYLGPPDNLTVFMRETNMLYISFQDQAGYPVYKFEIPISQMERAPDSMNYGMPTYQVEGQLPLALEDYEQFVQWTCEWD